MIALAVPVPVSEYSGYSYFSANSFYTSDSGTNTDTDAGIGAILGFSMHGEQYSSRGGLASLGNQSFSYYEVQVNEHWYTYKGASYDDSGHFVGTVEVNASDADYITVFNETDIRNATGGTSVGFYSREQTNHPGGSHVEGEPPTTYTVPNEDSFTTIYDPWTFTDGSGTTQYDDGTNTTTYTFGPEASYPAEYTISVSAELDGVYTYTDTTATSVLTGTHAISTYLSDGETLTSTYVAGGETFTKTYLTITWVDYTATVTTYDTTSISYSQLSKSYSMMDISGLLTALATVLIPEQNISVNDWMFVFDPASGGFTGSYAPLESFFTGSTEPYTLLPHFQTSARAAGVLRLGADTYVAGEGTDTYIASSTYASYWSVVDFFTAPTTGYSLVRSATTRTDYGLPDLPMSSNTYEFYYSVLVTTDDAGMTWDSSSYSYSDTYADSDLPSQTVTATLQAQTVVTANTLSTWQGVDGIESSLMTYLSQQTTAIETVQMNNNIIGIPRDGDGYSYWYGETDTNMWVDGASFQGLENRIVTFEPFIRHGYQIQPKLANTDLIYAGLGAAITMPYLYLMDYFGPDYGMQVVAGGRVHPFFSFTYPGRYPGEFGFDTFQDSDSNTWQISWGTSDTFTVASYSTYESGGSTLTSSGSFSNIIEPLGGEVSTVVTGGILEYFYWAPFPPFGGKPRASGGDITIWVHGVFETSDDLGNTGEITAPDYTTLSMDTDRAIVAKPKRLLWYQPQPDGGLHLYNTYKTEIYSAHEDGYNTIPGM